MSNANIQITVQTASTTAVVGNSIIGNPTDGTFGDGYVALTPTTLIADAIDSMNEALAGFSMAALGDAQAAACAASVAVGDVVSLGLVGGVATAAKAPASTLATKAAAGVVATKPTSTTCVVLMRGPCGGYSGLTIGAMYYAGATARPALVADLAAITGAYGVQPLGVAKTDSILSVNIGTLRALRSNP